MQNKDGRVDCDHCEDRGQPSQEDLAPMGRVFDRRDRRQNGDAQMAFELVGAVDRLRENLAREPENDAERRTSQKAGQKKEGPPRRRLALRSHRTVHNLEIR